MDEPLSSCDGAIRSGKGGATLGVEGDGGGVEVDDNLGGRALAIGIDHKGKSS